MARISTGARAPHNDCGSSSTSAAVATSTMDPCSNDPSQLFLPTPTLSHAVAHLGHLDELLPGHRATASPIVLGGPLNVEPLP